MVKKYETSLVTSFPQIVNSIDLAPHILMLYFSVFLNSFGGISNNNPVILLFSQGTQYLSIYFMINYSILLSICSSLCSIYPDEVERFSTKAWSNKKLCLP